MSDELSGVGRTTGARDDLVRRIMQRAVSNRECPFCPDNIEETNGEVLIRDLGAKHWSVWPSLSPYKGTSFHIMLASREHVLHIDELPDEAQLELFRIIKELRRRFEFVSYSLVSRLGDPACNSATVYHLHVHIVVSNGVPATPEMLPQERFATLQHLYQYVLCYTPPGMEAMEWVDQVREALDVLRAAQLGKAYPIRAKLSNKTAE